MIIALTCLIAVAAIAFVLFVRTGDLPPIEKPSPFAHLDERKAAIYENLRDLQFEYRVGKLSDSDYQSTKKDLQKELAGVLAETDRLRGVTPPVIAAKPVAQAGPPYVCPECKASFEQNLKFCGQCGKPMKATV